MLLRSLIHSLANARAKEKKNFIHLMTLYYMAEQCIVIIVIIVIVITVVLSLCL